MSLVNMPSGPNHPNYPRILATQPFYLPPPTNTTNPNHSACPWPQVLTLATCTHTCIFLPQIGQSHVTSG